jgi:hypothetical protein
MPAVITVTISNAMIGLAKEDIPSRGASLEKHQGMMSFDKRPGKCTAFSSAFDNMLAAQCAMPTDAYAIRDDVKRQEAA